MLGSSSTSRIALIAILLLSVHGRKVDDEAREFPLTTFDRNRAAVLADNREAQTQAEARPALVTPRRKERVEDLGQMPRLDPCAVVVELQVDELPPVLFLRAGFDPKETRPRALGAQRVLCVADDVDDHLAQTRVVGV